MTPRCSPWLNGVVERKIRHAIEIVKPMLLERDLGNKYRTYVCHYAVYIIEHDMCAMMHTKVNGEFLMNCFWKKTLGWY